MRLTRNVELLIRTLNEVFHLLAARKLFLIRLRNLLNRLLRCGDIKSVRKTNTAEYIWDIPAARFDLEMVLLPCDRSNISYQISSSASAAHVTTFTHNFF